MFNTSLPQLIIFSLDYIFWPFVAGNATPPFRKISSTNQVFGADGAELMYHKEVPEILKTLVNQKIKIGVISSCSTPSKPANLLALFGLDRYISYYEIYSRPSKVVHVRKIHEVSGAPCAEILYFDDDLDTLISMDRVLGVTGCKVPDGGLTMSTVHEGIKKFLTLKEEYSTTTLLTTTEMEYFPTWDLMPQVLLPKLVVFGLNYTLWPFFVNIDFELWDHMDTLRQFGRPPFKIRGDNQVLGLTGVKIKCYKLIPRVLKSFIEKGIKIGIILSSLYASIAAELLSIYGFREHISYVVAHTAPNRIQHLKRMKKASRTPYNEMLFFDEEPQSKTLHRVDWMLGVVRYEVPPEGLSANVVLGGVKEFAKHKDILFTIPTSTAKSVINEKSVGNVSLLEDGTVGTEPYS